MLTINLGLHASATGTDTITATYSPAPTLVNRKILFLRTSSGTNTTTSPTFNPNGLGAKPIFKRGGNPLLVGDMPYEAVLVYDSTNNMWTLLNPQGSELSQDIIDALYAASTANLANPFATMADVSGGISNPLARYDNTDTTNTGGTGEVYMKGLLVPTLTTNSILNIQASFEKTGTAGSLTWRLYYNTTNDLAGSPVKIGTGVHGATTLQTWFERSIVNKNSLTLNRCLLGTTAAQTDKVLSTNASQTINADLSGKYLVISVQNTNGADTAILANCQLYHYNP